LANTVVVNIEYDFALGVSNAYLHGRGTGVADAVGECFLRDSIRGEIDVGGERNSDAFLSDVDDET
jgi:hypothetical protein